MKWNNWMTFEGTMQNIVVRVDAILFTRKLNLEIFYEAKNGTKVTSTFE